MSRQALDTVQVAADVLGEYPVEHLVHIWDPCLSVGPVWSRRRAVDRMAPTVSSMRSTTAVRSHPKVGRGRREGRAQLAPRQSFWMGTLPISISRIVPAVPKSIVAVARGPTPSVATTVPRPYLSWLTRSPTSRDSAGVSFQPFAGPNVDVDDADERRFHVEVGADGAERSGWTRRQSISSAGISSRKREGGLVIGWPHADRTIARDRYRCRWARVMPTYASRRSSASSVGSPSARMCGKMPSSQPVQNTTGYSRPFAVCNVISVTTPVAFSSSPSG